VVSGAHGVAEMSSVALSGKTQQPLQTSFHKSGLYVQRGIAPEQAFDFMLNGSGSAQGIQAADDDQTAITVRCTGSDFILLNDMYLPAGFHQVICTGQAYDTAADDENFAMSAHITRLTV
jgi:hypothetical protein